MQLSLHVTFQDRVLNYNHNIAGQSVGCPVFLWGTILNRVYQLLLKSFLTVFKKFGHILISPILRDFKRYRKFCGYLIFVRLLGNINILNCVGFVSIFLISGKNSIILYKNVQNLTVFLKYYYVKITT